MASDPVLERVERQNRRIILLLGAIAVLLLALVVGLAASGWMLLHTYQSLSAHSVGLQAGLGDAEQEAFDLEQEVQRRQDDLSRRLYAHSHAALARLPNFQHRRAALEGFPPNPNAKLDHVTALNQLMSDELMVLVRLLSETVATLGDEVRPLRVQRDLAPPRASHGGPPAPSRPHDAR